MLGRSGTITPRPLLQPQPRQIPAEACENPPSLSKGWKKKATAIVAAGARAERYSEPNGFGRCRLLCEGAEGYTRTCVYMTRQMRIRANRLDRCIGSKPPKIQMKIRWGKSRDLRDFARRYFGCSTQCNAAWALLFQSNTCILVATPWPGYLKPPLNKPRATSRKAFTLALTAVEYNLGRLPVLVVILGDTNRVYNGMVAPTKSRHLCTRYRAENCQLLCGSLVWSLLLLPLLLPAHLAENAYMPSSVCVPVTPRGHCGKDGSRVSTPCSWRPITR